MNRVNDKKGQAKSKFGIHQEAFRFPLGGSPGFVANSWIYPAESFRWKDSAASLRNPSSDGWQGSWVG